MANRKQHQVAAGRDVGTREVLFTSSGAIEGLDGIIACICVSTPPVRVTRKLFLWDPMTGYAASDWSWVCRNDVPDDRPSNGPNEESPNLIADEHSLGSCKQRKNDWSVIT